MGILAGWGLVMSWEVRFPRAVRGKDDEIEIGQEFVREKKTGVKIYS